VTLETIIQIVTSYVYPALLVLFFFGLTIFVHELGHFLVARRRGMKVERFSIGFGPKIWGYKKDGIDYRVSWFPFGGYVALPQMAPMETIEGKTDSTAEQLPPASPLSKILVAFAGPVMNIIFAFLLGTILWKIGMPMPNDSAVIGWVEPGSLEEQKGLRPGDRIVEVSGKPISRWTELVGMVATSHEDTLKIVVERGDQTFTMDLDTPVHPQFGARVVNVFPRGRPFAQRVMSGTPAEEAGIRAGDKILAFNGVPIFSARQLIELVGKRADQATEIRLMRDEKIEVLQVTPRILPGETAARIGLQLGDEIVRPGPTPMQQFRDVFDLMGYTFKALMHSEKTGVGVKSLSGPVGIMGGWWYEFAYGGMRRGLWLAIVLNINLAILNLLPLPVLDGGHIVFAALEGIIRRPLNAKVVNALSTAFAVLLISFMLYVTFHDIQRFFGPVGRGGSRTSTNQVAPVTPE
jgi:regulator of sigma E protease